VSVFFYMADDVMLTYFRMHSLISCHHSGLTCSACSW
jgi:hypothetical protein